MSLILVTGPTGGGKTALVVDWFAFGTEFAGRPLFVAGIPDLKLDFQPVPPLEEWTELRPSEEDPSIMLPYFTFPPGSVIVLDEGQRYFRPRPTSAKVPDHVAAFETHRHCGIDIIVLTQHPSFIDAHARKLVRRHHHVFEHALGRDLLEWPRAADVESKAERVLARREKYMPPKRAFPFYKSAEAHTVLKRKLPKYVYLFVIASVVALALSYYGYQRIRAKINGGQVEMTAAGEKSEKPAPGVKSHAKRDVVTVTKTAAQYVEEQIPRLPGIPYSAPMYDAVTAPQQAPYPVACVATAKRCRCYDQQGNTYATTPDLCRGFVTDGLFIPWKSPSTPATSPAAPGADVLASPKPATQS